MPSLRRDCMTDKYWTRLFTPYFKTSRQCAVYCCGIVSASIGSGSQRVGDSLRNNCIPEAVPGETYKRGLGVGESVSFFIAPLVSRTPPAATSLTRLKSVGETTRQQHVY